MRYEELEAEVERLARTWEDDLLESTHRARRGGRAQSLMDQWAGRFPEYYKANDDWDLVVDDVVMLERLESTTEGFGVGNESKGERLTRVKLYKTGGRSTSPTSCRSWRRSVSAWSRRCRRRRRRRTRLHPRLRRVRLPGRGPGAGGGRRASPTPSRRSGAGVRVGLLNRLVTLSSLTWWEVRILRALRNYRMRVSARYTENYRNDAMAAYPSISERLVRMFEARFDPVRAASDEAIDEIRPGDPRDLRGVSSLDQDNILRHLLGTIEAIVRTNTSRTAHRSASRSCRSVFRMPADASLRGLGLVDRDGGDPCGRRSRRGGIRWSDHREDPHEVLGLMKAQKVKNAIIVPDGSKGLRAEADRDRRRAGEGRGRDAVRDVHGGPPGHHRQPGPGRGRPPSGVRIADGDDTFVVADKGTAALSDTANGVSERYGFWLGDASRRVARTATTTRRSGCGARRLGQ